VTVEAADNNVTWIERNLALNQVDPRSHCVVKADPVQFASDSAKESFDLIVVAPPSALGPATARRWDVLRDHGGLLQSTLPLLAADGQMYFVTTARRLKLAEGQLPDATLREITAQTVPPDHRNRRAHRCWSIRRRRDYESLKSSV
jgi:23S rRNA G2069 N7-methylase RlmK/C1962 C5-methylase RlmI